MVNEEREYCSEVKDGVKCVQYLDHESRHYGHNPKTRISRVWGKRRKEPDADSASADDRPPES